MVLMGCIQILSEDGCPKLLTGHLYSDTYKCLNVNKLFFIP